MTIAVFANNKEWDELTQNSDHIHWIRVNHTDELLEQKNIDALFNFESDKPIQYQGTIPYFINAVSSTLKSMGTNNNLIRFNGWPTFIGNHTWEIAGNISQETSNILQQLNKKWISVADEPGFISARVLSMIINEAYFALGENVSDKQDIDIAMKLGTNYPMGPFEWAEKIGIEKINKLMDTLAQNDDKYNIAPLLKASI